jgi:hypothetical protein
MKTAEFQVGDILPLVLILAVAGIGITYTLDILGDVRDDQTVGTMEYNATEDTIAGVAKFSSKFGLIATVIVAAILIGILVRYLAVRTN